ncbi:MAG: hypothetical protein WEB31_07560 [Chthoniobacterales bacterium]
MILHLSQAVAKRLKCNLSFNKDRVAQTGREDSWSADIFRIKRGGTHALVMHDASLWPFVIDLSDCRTYETFLKALLINIEMSYALIGRDFDGANVTVIATKRSNRSIIGSMNNAIFLLTARIGNSLAAGGRIDWAEIQADLSRTPFMSLDGIFPYKAWARLAGNPL